MERHSQIFSGFGDLLAQTARSNCTEINVIIVLILSSEHIPAN